MSTVEITILIQCLFLIAVFQQTHSLDDGYLHYIKNGCFMRGEALSCIKYKAVKIAQKAIFGDILNKNETIKANQIISLVPLDKDTIKELGIAEDVHVKIISNEPRGFLSEWAELAKYFMKLVQDFFKVKGLKVNLPEGARTVEDETEENDIQKSDSIDSLREKRDTPSTKTARGKRKKLTIIVPLLTLLAAIKTKLLLIPVLLSVMLIKKLLLIAALLLPSVLSTLKACKHHHPMTQYSYFGSSDSNDYSADYGSNYAYSATGSYGKDWAANRAYNMAKHRITPAPTYITAPGAVA